MICTPKSTLFIQKSTPRSIKHLNTRLFMTQLTPHQQLIQYRTEINFHLIQRNRGESSVDVSKAYLIVQEKKLSIWLCVCCQNTYLERLLPLHFTHEDIQRKTSNASSNQKLTHDQTYNKCLSKFVQTDNTSFSIKMAKLIHSVVLICSSLHSKRQYVHR